MMLRERQIPPQPGWPFELNHKFPDLAKSGIKIATEPTALVPSAEGDGKIKIVVNSFDASVSITPLLSFPLFFLSAIRKC